MFDRTKTLVGWILSGAGFVGRHGIAVMRVACRTLVTGCSNSRSGTLKLTELTRFHAIKMCQIGKNIKNIHRFGDSVLSIGEFFVMGRNNDKNKIGSGAGC